MAEFIDPTTNTKMNTKTEDEYKIEIVDGKVQITGLVSEELASSPA